MKKKDLCDYVKNKTSLRPAQAKEVVEAVFEGLSESLSNNEPIFIRGFATLRPCITRRRTGYNFTDGSNLTIEPQPKVKVVLSENLKKRMLNGF